MTRRQTLLALGGVVAVIGGIPLGWSAWAAFRFPSDRTPDGCYLRIALALSKSRLEDCFAYVETESQHALFAIHQARREALALVRTSFEEPERSRLIEAYGAEGDAPDPAGCLAVMGRQRGWDARLRRDLSGIRSIEIVGDRATVETAQGTRYPFRRGTNGLWGLTIFTAELVAHRDRTARDLAVVRKAADEYEHARASK